MPLDKDTYLALSGGVGGAKLALGLSHCLAGGQLTVEACLVRDTATYVPDSMGYRYGYGIGIHDHPMSGDRGEATIRSCLVERNLEWVGGMRVAEHDFGIGGEHRLASPAGHFVGEAAAVVDRGVDV